MARNRGWAMDGLEPIVEGGMTLLADARARLADPSLSEALEGPRLGELATLLLDLTSALLLLRAVAAGDLPTVRGLAEAERLDLPGQVARSLAPALLATRVPAVQVVLLQVNGLAAQVLAVLDACAEAPEPIAQQEKPRRRPSGRPRLHVVPSED